MKVAVAVFVLDRLFPLSVCIWSTARRGLGEILNVFLFDLLIKLWIVSQVELLWILAVCQYLTRNAGPSEGLKAMLKDLSQMVKSNREFN